MNPQDRALVVVLRQTQWLLDDAAHDIPGGRYGPERHRELAAILTRLADLVLRRIEPTKVIDGESGEHRQSWGTP